MALADRSSSYVGKSQSFTAAGPRKQPNSFQRTNAGMMTDGNQNIAEAKAAAFPGRCGYQANFSGGYSQVVESPNSLDDSKTQPGVSSPND
jgi:hypothetical protein